MEAAGVLRAIGEWNASYGRWKQAAECFTALMQANRLATPQRIAESSDLLLPGPALIEAADLAGYKRFRSETLERFIDCTNTPIASEHVIKISLMLPADEMVLERLVPFAQSVAGSLNDQSVMRYPAWSATAMALLDYRRGNFTNALLWAQKSLQYTDANPASLATTHAVIGMVWQQLGQADTSHSELSQARILMENSALKPGIAGSMRDGYWYDWATVRRLLKEASTLN
jgi:hypothetical protein